VKTFEHLSLSIIFRRSVTPSKPNAGESMIGDKDKAIRNKAKQRQRTDEKKLAVEAIANIIVAE
jgi:hypothetical protein